MLWRMKLTHLFLECEFTTYAWGYAFIDTGMKIISWISTLEATLKARVDINAEVYLLENVVS